ncbi:MAG: hypothetical protein K6C11_01980 [Bacilli bacterium]|nr:hypothetical protein [Bacilli bacterium]
MKNNEYRSVLTFWFNNKHYHMFEDNNYKYAFLLMDDENKYHYPTLKELLEVTEFIMNRKEGVYLLQRDRKRKAKKKYKFIPKVITTVGLVILTTSVLGLFKYSDALSAPKDEKVFEIDYDNLNDKQSVIIKEPIYSTSGNTSNIKLSSITVHEHTNDNSNNQNTNNHETSTSSITVHEHTEEENNQEENINNNSSSIVINNYEEDDDSYFANYIAAADDEYDYKWANDYYYNDIARLCKVRDAKGYEQVFGYDKPTYNDLSKVVDKNKNIDKKYKDFIKNYINDWLTLYPDTDFSNFYYNLQTLKIEECSQSDMKWAALSTEAVACYRQSENKIYIQEGTKLNDKSSDDYIILSHELTHVARTGKHNINNNNVSVGFYEGTRFGLYEDEAIDTYFIYQMQGLNKRSDYYRLSSNYTRIIMDAIGNNYTGSDYMNHSINYYAEQMDKFMEGTEFEGTSLYTLSLIDAEMDIYYSNNTTVDPESLQDLFDYMITMYCKKHINTNTSASEAEEVFNDFMYEMTYNLDGLQKPYQEITTDAFRPGFESYCNDLGISLSRTR